MTAGRYPWRAEDLKILLAAAESLEQYLLSPVLYWPVDGSTASLTPGNLLLALTRLAYPPKYEEKCQRIQKTRQVWQAAWQRKASGEFDERVGLWNTTVREFFASASHTRPYPQDIRWRVLIELLQPEIGDARGRSEAAILEATDHIFRSGTKPSEFIWPLELQTVFPNPRFWFLYRSRS